MPFVQRVVQPTRLALASASRGDERTRTAKFHCTPGKCKNNNCINKQTATQQMSVENVREEACIENGGVISRTTAMAKDTAQQQQQSRSLAATPTAAANHTTVTRAIIHVSQQNGETTSTLGFTATKTTATSAPTTPMRDVVDCASPHHHHHHHNHLQQQLHNQTNGYTCSFSYATDTEEDISVASTTAAAAPLSLKKLKHHVEFLSTAPSPTRSASAGDMAAGQQQPSQRQLQQLQRQRQQQQQRTQSPTAAKIVSGHEFESISNLTLSNALRQLASLVLLANDIFDELQTELLSVGERARTVQRKIIAVEQRVSAYDPKMVTVPPIIGTRHIQCFLCFCCLSICYALRVNLSVGIVAMTDRNSTNSDLTVYDWTESTKSYVLSSFFWGYIVTQIPGGHIAQKYGAKTLLLIGITLCSVLTLLTPLAVEYGGWQLLFAVRVIQGLLQGSVHPATHAMLAKWSPVDERGALSTFCYSGSQFGTVIILAISGIIAESPLGWPGIFYISGALGILWGVCWFIFSASTPAEHKTISLEERKFIENSLGQVDSTPTREVPPTPWGKIFTSPPFLSLIIVHCTHMWGFWTLLTQIPNYMKNILGVDMKNSALLSSLPYAVMCLLSFFFIYLSKVLARRENVSLSFSRKFFNSIGHWIPMISLIGLGYVTKEHSLLAVILLTLTVGISGATYLGFQVNHIDLSPTYAGTLMGITNGSANVMSALAPLAVGLVVTDVTNVVEWRYVFFIAAGFYFVGNLLFVIFGKTEVQSWNSPEDALAKRLNVVDAESPALLINGDKKKITITENGTQ